MVSSPRSMDPFCEPEALSSECLSIHASIGGSWVTTCRSSSFVKQQASKGKGKATVLDASPARHVTKSTSCTTVHVVWTGQEVRGASATCKPEGTRPAGPPFCLQLGEHSEFAGTCMAGSAALALHCRGIGTGRQHRRLTELLDQSHVFLPLSRLCSCMPRFQGHEPAI
jgi:hypothetical protein